MNGMYLRERVSNRRLLPSRTQIANCELKMSGLLYSSNFSFSFIKMLVK